MRTVDIAAVEVDRTIINGIAAIAVVVVVVRVARTGRVIAGTVVISGCSDTDSNARYANSDSDVYACIRRR
jgi:hypothetical protein